MCLEQKKVPTRLNTAFTSKVPREVKAASAAKTSLSFKLQTVPPWLDRTFTQVFALSFISFHYLGDILVAADRSDLGNTAPLQSNIASCSLIIILLLEFYCVVLRDKLRLLGPSVPCFY